MKILNLKVSLSLLATAMFLTSCDSFYQSRCEKAAKETFRLRDPDSAIFRPFEEVTIKNRILCDKNGIRMIQGCFQVNARKAKFLVGSMNSKNGYGGYGNWNNIYCIATPTQASAGYLRDCSVITQDGPVKVCW